MEENQKDFNAEDLKKETSETVNQVKDAIKSVNFKQDSKETKGFFSSFLKDPLCEIKKAASSRDNKFIKIATVILAVWLATVLVSNFLSIATTYHLFSSFSYFFQTVLHHVFELIKDLVTPIITILVLTGLVYGLKKVKNRSFLTIASTILITKIPVVIANFFSLSTLVSTHFLKLTSAFSGFCSVLSMVFLFFAIKDLSEEEKNDSYFWKFAIIMGIFYIVKFVLSYLGIYL